MVTAALEPLELTPDVRAFLRKHAAEDAFLLVCSLVRECHPHLREMRVWLQDDPDVDDRQWCVIGIELPLIENVDERAARWRHYHRRLGEAFPPPLALPFAVSESYTRA